MADITGFTENELKNFLERLVLYASWKFNRLGWRTRKGFDRAGPSGASPQDIAQEAITSILEGKRKYNREAYSGFYHFLKSIVDSKISHLCESVKNEKVKIVSISQRAADNDTYEDMEFESKETNPAKTYINEDVANNVKELLAKEFIDDEIVNGILDCVEADIMKPANMAEIMDVDIKEIYNAKKRLRRTIIKSCKT